MSEKKQPSFQGLPNISFRQLEVFHVVCRETSYANAAVELKSTRTNIKRVCDNLEKSVGRPLFNESADRTLLHDTVCLRAVGSNQSAIARAAPSGRNR